VGLKPTYGRVSRYGSFPLGYSLDHMGPLTATVRDKFPDIAGLEPARLDVLHAGVSSTGPEVFNDRIHGLTPIACT